MKNQKSKQTADLNVTPVEDTKPAMRQSQTGPVEADAEFAESEVIPPLIEDDTTSQNHKTYLVKFGTCTTAMSESREDFSTGLVRAPNLQAAYEVALKLHVPEGFEEEDEDTPAGEWVEIDTEGAVRLGFEFNDDRPAVDAGCILWVEKVREIAPEHVAAIELYLWDW